jgi:predicted ATPase
MRFAISGAQGTGKTTIIEALKTTYKDQLKGHTILPSPTRILSASVPINENGTEFGQKTILASTISRVFQLNTIADRCFLDTIAYTKFLYDRGEISDEFLEYNTLVVSDLHHLYDQIFYIAPEFDIIVDDVRSGNTDYRDKIVANFEYYIKTLDIPVIRLTGTVEQRVQQILGEL